MARGSANPMIDVLEERTQRRDTPDEPDVGQGDPEITAVERVEPLSFADRARAILLLSLLCWGVIVAALVWLFA